MNTKESRVELASSRYPQYRCGPSVLLTYAQEAGLNEEEAIALGRPLCGGRQGTCGAVLAAQYIIGKYDESLVDEVERRFNELNRTSQCKTLKGFGTGEIIRDCPGCVADACQILEDLLQEIESRG